MKILAIALVTALPLAAPVALHAQNRGALLAYAAHVPDSATSEATRTVEYALHENGRLVGSQVVELEEGRTTAVAVSNGYSLRVRVDRATGEGAPAYVVRSSLYRPAAPSWALVARPELTVAQGQPGAVSLASEQGSRLSVRVTVR